MNTGVGAQGASVLRRHAGPALFGTLLFILLLNSGAARADTTYDAVWARSVELEEAGDAMAAANELSLLKDTYPQDYNLHLRLGWLLFQAHQYPQSVEAYALALALNPESADALLGLAWCDYRMGDSESAHDRFSRVLAARPGDPSATQGADLTKPSRFEAWVDLFYLLYSRHPYRNDVQGVAVGSWLELGSPVRIMALYRGSLHNNPGKTGTPGNWLKQDFSQNEAFVGLGFYRSGWQAVARYGFLDNDSGALETTHVVGLDGTFQGWGTLAVDSSLSLYDDGKVWRAGVRYSMPLAHWFVVTPGLAGQYVVGKLLGSVLLAVEGSAGSIGWSLGGRYGEEQRPAYMDQWVVQNSTDRFMFGAWAGLKYELGWGMEVSGTYEYRAIASERGSNSGNSKGGGGTGVNAFVIGFSWKE